jgi:hypothetical protein
MTGPELLELARRAKAGEALTGAEARALGGYVQELEWHYTALYQAEVASTAFPSAPAELLGYVALEAAERLEAVT